MVNKLLLKVKRLFNQIRGLFPSDLPTGMKEFDAWVDSIIETYDLPTADRTSIRFLFATACINQQNPLIYRRPKFYFVRMIRHAANKQVAGSVFQEIKREQQEAEKNAKVEFKDGSK